MRHSRIGKECLLILSDQLFFVGKVGTEAKR